MEIVGAISKDPARQFLAVTGAQAKGLDRLVNDPADALRRLGEQPLNTNDRTTNTPAISPARDNVLSASLVRQGIEEAARKAATPEADKAAEKSAANAANEQTKRPGELSEGEQRAVDELRARDREVRAHEQAHKAVGGPYAGAISYTYQEGPDGKQYAVGGEVPIDVSPEATAEATIAKMRIVIAAALAPAEPSAADRSVAQAAQAQLMQASVEARQESLDKAAALQEGRSFDLAA